MQSFRSQKQSSGNGSSPIRRPWGPWTPFLWLLDPFSPAGLTPFLCLPMHPTQLLQKAPKLEKRLADYCAVSMFVYLLTTKGYNFNNHSFPNIAFQKKVGNTRACPHAMMSAWS